MPDISIDRIQEKQQERWTKKALRSCVKKFTGPSNDEVRDAWIKRTLEGLPAGSKILDAGAGESQYKKYCQHLRYVSQDFNQYDGRGDQKGLQMGSWNCSQIDIVCDIISIPKPDHSFDVILCTEVLEHIPAPIDALKEFARLLRPGGQLILTAPFASLTHFAPFHFYSGFNNYFYEKWLKEFGFTDIFVEANGNYFDYMKQELLRIYSVSQRYTVNRRSLKFLELCALGFLLKALKRFSRKDAGSHALLCYGFFIRAKKA